MGNAEEIAVYKRNPKSGHADLWIPAMSLYLVHGLHGDPAGLGELLHAVLELLLGQALGRDSTIQKIRILYITFQFIFVTILMTDISVLN